MPEYLSFLAICSANLLISHGVEMNQANIASIGLNFVTIFAPIDQNRQSNDNDLILELINSNKLESAKVTIDFVEYFENSPINYSMQIDVPPLSSKKIPFHDAVVKHFSNFTDGLSRQADSRIFVSSTAPISLLQHTYNKNGTGDSFIVLPQAMSGNSYAFTLPTSKQIVYFIPTSNEANIRLSALKNSSSVENVTFKIQRERGTDQTVYLGSDNVTIFVWSNNSFQVIVAIEDVQLPKKNATHNFGNTMPSATPEIMCLEKQLNDSESDLHPTKLSHIDDFYSVTSASINCHAFNATLLLNSSAHQSWLIEPNRLQTILAWSTKTPGDVAVAESSIAAIEVLHFGTSSKQKDIYMDMVSARSQYITGFVGFVVRSETDQITVFGDLETSKNGTVDGRSLNFDEIIFGHENQTWDSVYWSNVSSLSPGFHSMSSSGNYIVFINGTDNDGAVYGYTVAINGHQFPYDSNLNPTPPTTTPGASSITRLPVQTIAACILILYSLLIGGN